MATRSTIAIEYLDGTIRQIYCHWDGYLDHNGRILQEHYSNPNKLNQIIELGDLSSLGKNIGTKHDFTDSIADQCKFYGRDREEKFVDAKKFSNFAEYMTNCRFEEYNYILRFINGESIWFVQHWESGDTFEPLVNAFKRASVEALK